MIERLTPPQWDDYEEGMLLNVADAKLYYEAYTDVLDKRSEQSGLEIITLDGRVTALEQSTPVGPGGKGAYLNLGGTPERYPTAEEMVAGDTPEQTSFLVVARTDGIYFYNPKSKLLIPPKKGGGTVAVHASFPDIFDDGHSIKHDTRIGKSGVYTAKCADVGLDSTFLSYDTVKILVVTTADMEYQTALHPDGTASRTFTPGNNVTPWSFHTGSGSGGGSIDPVVIQEINRRLAALEAKPDPIGTFEGLSDVAVDVVTDVNGLLYLGEDGKVRGGAINPMLAMGYTPIQAASVGFISTAVTGNVAAVIIAASPVVLMTAEANRTATLPNIVPFNTVKPSTTQIREGRLTYFVNTANMQKTLRVTSGQRFHKDGNMDSANVVLPGKTTYIYNSAILDNGSGAMLECFVFMGQIQHQDADMSSIMDGFTNLANMHDAQQVEIDFIRKEQESGKLVVEGLQTGFTDVVDRIVDVENKVVTKFTEMTDTPSGYFPGKMLAYNMAGDGITAVDAVDTFRGLKDTPGTYAGNAHKAVTVKSDESGVEFSSMPNLTPLQNEVNGLHNDLVGINNSQYIQDQRLTALEAGGGGGGSSSFIGLTDTPNSWTGTAGMAIAVNAAEDGIEFIEPPEIAILGAMGEGNLPIKWNNMKQKIAASSSNIAASAISENAFTLGLGSIAGRKFILPDIVDADLVPLPANSVREGRLTVISQQGEGNRTVELSGGCKFASAGVISTAVMTIPTGQSWVLLPALYGNGDKVWSLIGSFSSNPTGADLVGGNVRIGHRNITADSYIVVNGSITQEKSASCRLVAPVSSSSRAITFPELVPFSSTGPLTNVQARQGKIITVWSASTSSTNLNLATGQKWLINNVESTGVRTLPKGVMETYLGIISGGVGKWVLMSRNNADGSPVEIEGVNATIAALEARIAALEARP